MTRDNEERRCFRPIETLRFLGGGGPPRIEGLAVPYGELSENIGGFREMVTAGAFKKSLRSGPDVRADVEHDRTRLVGRTKNGSLVLTDSPRGLRARITLPKTTLAEEVAEAVRSGLIDGMSVSWDARTVRANFTRDDNGETIRVVQRADLTGIALTAFPAYPQTAGELTLRSLAAWQKDQRRLLPDYRRDVEQLRLRLEEAEDELALFLLA